LIWIISSIYLNSALKTFILTVFTNPVLWRRTKKQ
jgi:hypothetical protein